jgi:hypothetical protein
METSFDLTPVFQYDSKLESELENIRKEWGMGYYTEMQYLYAFHSTMLESLSRLNDVEAPDNVHSIVWDICRHIEQEALRIVESIRLFKNI